MIGTVSAPLDGVAAPGIAIGASPRIEQAHLSTGQTVAAFVVFLVLATIGLIVPIALYLLRPETSAATLERWRAWLLRNQRAAGAVLLLVIGFSLAMRGVQGLLE